MMAAETFEAMVPPPIPPRSSSRQQLRYSPSPVPLKPAPADMDIGDVKLWDMRPLAITKRTSLLLPSTYNFRFLPGGSFKVSKWKAIYPPESCDDGDITSARPCKLPPSVPRVGLPDQKLQPAQEKLTGTDGQISEKEISTNSPVSKQPLLARFATQTKHLYDSFWNHVQHKSQFEVLSQETEKRSPSATRDRSCFGGQAFTSIGDCFTRLFDRPTIPTKEMQETVCDEDGDTETIKVWWHDEPPPSNTSPPTSEVQVVSVPWTGGKGQGYHRRFEGLETQTFGQDFRESLGMELPG